MKRGSGNFRKPAVQKLCTSVRVGSYDGSERQVTGIAVMTYLDTRNDSSRGYGTRMAIAALVQYTGAPNNVIRRALGAISSMVFWS